MSEAPGEAGVLHVDIPHDVLSVMERLTGAGYEAFLVGGCVRDALLGKQPSDYDVASDATPEVFRRIFSGERLLNYGAKHGTVGIATGQRVVEVTTYRIDGKYTDGRRPDSVNFTRSLSQDLLRRDFTVNAFAYSPHRGLVDEVGGLLDLRGHLVRCVGDPVKRYGEDALRILRCLRFSSSLDFLIEGETFSAALRMGASLRKIAPERIQVELTKLLLGAGAERVLSCGRAILGVCVPGFEDVSNEGYEIMCRAVGRMPARAEARLAAFFSPLGALKAKEAFEALRFSGEMTDGVLHRIEIAALDMGEPLALQRALGHFGLSKVLDGLTLAEAYGANIQGLKERAQDLIDSGACLTIKQLAVNGSDVLGEGIKPGKQVGEILSALLDGVMAGKYENQRQTLFDAIRTFL